MGDTSAPDLSSSSNHRTRRLDLFLAVSIATIGFFLLAPDDAVAQEYFRLQLKQGGKFLDARNCSDNVALHPGSDYANGACQLWRFVPAGDGWSRLQLKQGGKYLDAVHCTDNVALNPGSNYANGACQLWRFVRAHTTQDNRPSQTAAPPSPTIVQTVDEHCDNYATAAVRQFKLTQSRRECAVRSDGRWQANYDAHYNWCLRAPQNARGAEQGAREDWLYRCGAAYKY